MALVHHELCFGCGRSNLFGLLLDVERAVDGAVAGRCFIKQDHQGPERGMAHPGLLSAALIEAMLLTEEGGTLRSVSVELEGGAGAPVGAFVELQAWPAGGNGAERVTEASAAADGQTLARARAVLAPAGVPASSARPAG